MHAMAILQPLPVLHVHFSLLLPLHNGTTFLRFDPQPSERAMADSSAKLMYMTC